MSSDSQESNLYGYVPTLWICASLAGAFGATFVLHFFQMVRSRYWFLAVTFLPAGILEFVGWAARVWSNRDIYNQTPYIAQSTTLVLAPTFLLAAHFIVFGRIVALLGTEYSRLRPKLYTIIFLGGDIISLFTQGAGGGMSAQAKEGNKAKLGLNLLLVGIGIQVAMIASFSILAVEYTVRHIRDKPLKRASSNGRRTPMNRGHKTLLIVLATTTTLLFIRGIYRLIELAGGLDNPIKHTEWPFIMFEGATIFNVIGIWNMWHPSKYLEGQPKPNYDTVLLAEAGGPK